MPDVQLETQETPGSVAVVSGLEAGTGDFGFATADVVYLAYRRGIAANPHPHSNLRAIAVRWVNAMNVIVPADSPVRNVEDLAGKRVGIVPPGSSAELFTRILLDAHGLDYAAIDPVFLPLIHMPEEVRRRRLSAAIMETAPVYDSLPNWHDGDNLRALPIRREVINRIRGRYPFVKPAQVKMGGQSLEAIGLDSVLICRKDLSEEVVYQITKELVAMVSAVARTVNVPARIDPDSAPATPIPLHPGAARYHREREILQ